MNPPFTLEQQRLQKIIVKMIYEQIIEIERVNSELTLMPVQERVRVYVSGILQGLANIMYDEGYYLKEENNREWMKQCIELCFAHTWDEINVREHRKSVN